MLKNPRISEIEIFGEKVTIYEADIVPSKKVAGTLDWSKVTVADPSEEELAESARKFKEFFNEAVHQKREG